jgi:hypothetical protein
VPAVFSRLPVHDGATQTVSGASLGHPPDPSQAPVSPQLEAPLFTQMPRGSAAAAATGQQEPTRPL